MHKTRPQATERNVASGTAAEAGTGGSYCSPGASGVYALAGSVIFSATALVSTFIDPPSAAGLMPRPAARAGVYARTHLTSSISEGGFPYMSRPVRKILPAAHTTPIVVAVVSTTDSTTC